jgi:SNF2 family DNA or RNA helicase
MFLLSSRACGLGVDLPSISAIIILDSDWNPRADLQALARAHCLGRAKGSRPLRILRLFMRNSVEEKILLLAERRGGVSAAFRPGSAAG